VPAGESLFQLFHERWNVPHPVQILLPQRGGLVLKTARPKALQLPADLLDLGVAVNQFEKIFGARLGAR
jgi:hypothetical protein